LTTLTTKEVAQATAGGDSFIRTKNNVVEGLAITTEMNPEAPERIIVGKGTRRERSAVLLAETAESVPVYLKIRINEWRYIGRYTSEKFSRTKHDIEKYHCTRPIDEVSGILFLKQSEEVNVSVSLPSNPENRKKTEKAAIDHVWMHYQQQGFTIHDRQKDNCGYDLLVQQDSKFLKIEVKGTSMETERFFISRNERMKSVDPLWRLAIVTNALDNPKLNVMDSVKMEELFDFDALCWECTI
jgi:hypothetical protein